MQAYRFSARLALAPRAQLFRPAVIARPFSHTPLHHAETSHSPNVHEPKAPVSDSPQEADVKSSRATDDPKTTELGGSLAQPVSGKGDQVGNSEEGDAGMKKGSPSEPDHVKRERMEKSQKPLDAADK